MALTRENLLFSRLGNLNNLITINFNQNVRILPILISTREKHYIPKWKWHRQQKFIPVELPNFHLKGAEKREQVRAKLKELGVGPPRYWKERPMTITSIPSILNPYVPVEGDGKYSLSAKDKAQELMSNISSKKDNILAIRKIKSYDENFSTKLFPQIAHDIYVKAHTVLMNKNSEELMEFVTDRCLSEMLEGVKGQTIRWKFIKSLEPPVVVHARTTCAITKNNHFAQVTVRFHTQQSLAIYDRFGRLMYGSEIIPKDVLEYAVFEKHIVNVYGVWRLHAKIIPDWTGPPEPSAKTYVVEQVDDESDKTYSDVSLAEDIAAVQNIKESAEEAEAKK